MGLGRFVDDSGGLEEFLQKKKENIIGRKAPDAPFDPSDYDNDMLEDKLKGVWTVQELEDLLELEKIERADGDAMSMIKERAERRKGTDLDEESDLQASSQG